MNKNDTNNKIKKIQFRLRGKKLYLTYPQLNPNIEFLREEALKQLKDKINGVLEYVISQEKHQDGGIHLHCFLGLGARIDISDPHYLDLVFNHIPYHGNYQIGKRKQALLEYLIKEDENLLTNMHLPSKDGQLLKPEEYLMLVCKEQGFNKMANVLYDHYPILAVQKGRNILRKLKKFSELNLKEKMK